MPVHDWSRVEHGIFHDFHQAWTIGIRNGLNGGALAGRLLCASRASGCRSGPGRSDVAALVTERERPAAVDWQWPMRRHAPRTSCRRKPNLTPRGPIASSSNTGSATSLPSSKSFRLATKSSHHALKSFVEKAYDLLQQGIHLLIIDLLPPTPRDPTASTKPFGTRSATNRLIYRQTSR